MPEIVDVSAIVVTWNNADTIGECLRYLLSGSHEYRLQVIVVDNASTDETTELVRAQFPEVTLIANQTNRGYAAANNQALPLSHGRYILLHNPDAKVLDGAIDRLVAFADAHPRLGAVGPRLVNGDGTLQRGTAGAFPSLATCAAYFFLLHRVWPKSARFQNIFLSEDLKKPTQVDWISGAMCLLRAAVVRELGGLDERYFMYMEDVDLCYRMNDAGWQVYYQPESSVVHYLGHNTRARVGQVSPHSIRNFNAYFRRRHGLLATLALKGMEAMGFGGRTIGYLVGARARGNASWARQAHLHWQYFKLSCELRV